MIVNGTNRTKSDQPRPSRAAPDHLVSRGPDARTLRFAAALLIEDTHPDEREWTPVKLFIPAEERRRAA